MNKILIALVLAVVMSGNTYADAQSEKTLEQPKAHTHGDGKPHHH